MSSVPSTMIPYEGECRGCGRTLRRPIAVEVGKSSPPGIPIRCLDAECGKTAWAKENKQ